MTIVFFFSSRRRHTRWTGDWSSDVCSSDLAEFAIDRMRRRQQFSERLAAHHIGTRGRIEPVGRIRLPALELQDGQRSLIAFDVFAHPALKAQLIDPMPLLDGS